MIFAVDFDGCMYLDGHFNSELASMLCKHRADGDKVILWTCRCGCQLDEAKSICALNGLEFDAINDNLPEMKERYGNDSRKVFADYYLDDRAVRADTWQSAPCPPKSILGVMSMSSISKNDTAVKVVQELIQQYVRKNKDYGNSAHLSYEKFGDIAYLVRIGDKLNRYNNLKSNDRNVLDETVADTVGDMYTYLCMWLAEAQGGTLESVTQHMQEIAEHVDELNMVKALNTRGMDMASEAYAEFNKDTPSMRLGAWAMNAAISSIAAYTYLVNEPF